MSNLSISPSVTLSSLLSELASEAPPASLQAELADATTQAMMGEVDGITPAQHGDAAGGAGDTLAHGLKSLNFGTAHAHTSSALQGAAGAEAVAQSPTLQDMAQAVPRHDIASERHGTLADNAGGPASASSPQSQVDADLSGGLPGVSVARPDAAGVNPVARDVQVTLAPASLLHQQPAEFRSSLSPTSPTEEAKKQRGEHDEDGAAGQHPHPDQDPEETRPAALDDLLVKAEVTAASDATGGLPGMAGDAELYQQIVAALHAVGATAGPVFDVLEELRRQRRVVVATPNGLTSGLRCAAHVDVLWPVAGGGGRALRLAGELLWAQSGFDTDWLMTHLVKAQAQGSVRQLSPVSAEQDARRIAVCLGAQATPMVAWSQACLRVRDGTRLWRALEPQWSLRLAICTLPLSLQAGGHSSHPSQAPGAHHHAA